jgi:DNA-binding LacI/PurR family transcriptional regulator
MAQYNLSYSTVSRAVQELTRLGLITRRVGSGSRVAERSRTPTVFHLIGGVPSAAQRGLCIFRDLVEAALAKKACVEPHEGLDQDARAALVEGILRRRQAGGGAREALVFPFFAGNRPHIDRCCREGVPYVVLDVPHAMSGYSIVLRDHHAAARRLVERLLSAGHRAERIGLILGSRDQAEPDPVQWDFAKARGALEALGGGGAVAEERCAWDVECRSDEGARAARRLLDRTPELTAFFCDHDLKAVGVLNELAARGMDVPQRISLVCINRPAVPTPLPLTCAWASPEGVGEAAVALLMATLGEKKPTVRSKELPMRFQDGETLAPP